MIDLAKSDVQVKVHRAQRFALLVLLTLLTCGGGCNNRQQNVAEQPTSEGLQEASDRLLKSSTFLGNARRIRLEKRLNDKKLAGRELWNSQKILVNAYLAEGNNDEAMRLVDQMFDIHQAIPDESKAELHYLRGVVHLRQAEVDNCISNHCAHSCIFPVRSGGQHGVAEPTRAALNDFLKSRELSSVDEQKKEWLMLVTRQLLGDESGEQMLKSSLPFVEYADVAQEAGLATINLSGGVVIDDFDGDGWLDVVTSSLDPREPVRLFTNKRDGTFEEKTEQAGLSSQVGSSLNCTAADYDSDGDVDILILRGAWLGAQGRIRNSLMRNDGTGKFEDVTFEAGLAEPAYPTQVAVWGDFNNDGHLDLFVGNESTKLSYGVRRKIENHESYPNQLFMNDGRGHFVDRAVDAGVASQGNTKGAAAADYDNDGDLDLFIANMAWEDDQPNQLFENVGDAVFVDVTEKYKVDFPAAKNFATWFFDYDNDGWQDLFIGSWDGSWRPSGNTKVLRNLQGREFQDVSAKLGLDQPYSVMGASFGDLDNDGFLDIYLGTGAPDFAAIVPNRMFRNNGGNLFEDVTANGGFGHLQKGHGICFADLDNDGDQDVFAQMGGAFVADQFANALFQNPGHGNRFIVLTLKGTQSTRSAVGARIKIEVETDSGLREIHRTVGGMSSFGYVPLRQEIGLGVAKKIEQITIDWPASGIRQLLEDIPVDQYLEVVEPSDASDLERSQSEGSEVPEATGE